MVPGEKKMGGMEPGEEAVVGGRRVKKATVKQLKKMLKKAGLKTTGKRGALTRRAKKAHLKIRGGAAGEVVEGAATMKGGAALSPDTYSSGAPAAQAGGRRKSRKSRGFRLY
jgi:hypothetical protein